MIFLQLVANKGPEEMKIGPENGVSNLRLTLSPQITPEKYKEHDFIPME